MDEVVAEAMQTPESRMTALLRASALLVEGTSEDRLVAGFVRLAAEAFETSIAAVYYQPGQPLGGRTWRLAAHVGGEVDAVQNVPTAFGTGTGVLAPLFQAAREVHEPDLLNGAPEGATVPDRLPARTVVGLPIRRRRGKRVMGALIVGSARPNAFDDAGLTTLRSLAQLLGVGIDNARLAARQQRERRLIDQSQATLATVLGSVGSGVCVVELDGTVRVANQALQEMFGMSGRLVGLSQQEAFATAASRPREWDAFVARLEELLADRSEVDESEWELATDPQRIVQRFSAPMRNTVGEIVGRVDVYTEITESRRLYTQLLSSEKLRAIGEMASGVAHDFNNLLASILGQVELLHPDEVPAPTREAIATIRQSALDGARIVRNLQGLARPRLETPSTTADLNEAVLAALDMARPRWATEMLHGHGAIDVGLDLAESNVLSRVAIDPVELREVLLNLLFNAADAMPEGGRIDIVTRPGQNGKTADLVVRDTGHGMSEAVRVRIFEPFFSTKGPKGSGLGLAVAYSIITRRGGSISVESEVDRGTTFTLNLPYVPIGTAGTSAAEPATVAAPRRLGASGASAVSAREPLGASIRGARILVADDEPGLVAIVRQLMQRSGAQVSIAHGGPEALDAIKQGGPGKFDVVITDLDMPEVDGWAVAEAVKAHSPDTHVVMLTGWAGEIAPEDFKQRGVEVVLAKPCSRPELEAAIGGLLTARPVTGLDVLLVEDEERFARAVRDMLALQGHQVTHVASAAAALEVLDSHRFDVVLTDYSLGEMTGADLAEQLAERSEAPFVVLVTGYATEIDDATLMSKGVNAVLPKPCRGDDLREVLSRVPH